jgi:hypothetical protein
LPLTTQTSATHKYNNIVSYDAIYTSVLTPHSIAAVQPRCKWIVHAPLAQAYFVGGNIFLVKWNASHRFDVLKRLTATNARVKLSQYADAK